MLISHSVVSHSLWPHGLQHIRLSYSLLSPIVCSNSFTWVNIAIQPSYPLPPLCPLALNVSIRVFSNELALCIRWPNYWSFCISPSNVYSGFISFRIHWFDLLAVKRTLKSLLQHNSKASVLWCSAFFMVQLSHLYTTTGKSIALTRWTFVGKMMSLLLNTLSRLVIAFLPRRKSLLISWLQSPSAVILESKKIKSVTVATFPPPFGQEVMGQEAMSFIFWMLSFKLLVHSPLSPSSSVSLVPLCFLP